MAVTNKSKKLILEEGFTLTEMLVVLIIIGLLTMLAVPRFAAVIRRTKMTEAKLMLNQVYTLEEAYNAEYDKYTTNLDAIGFEQETLISDDGTARYQIEIESATDTSFIATATSIVDFDKDGTYNVWTINHNKQLVQKVQD